MTLNIIFGKMANASVLISFVTVVFRFCRLVSFEAVPHDNDISFTVMFFCFFF